MPVFLVTLFQLLSGVPGMIGDYFKKKQEIQTIQMQTQMQIEIEKQKLAAELAKAEVERAKAALSATSQTFKYVAFGVWFGPYVLGLVAPSWSKHVFENLAGMPEWYVQSVVLIMFTIWGISTASPVVGTIFSSMQEFFKERRNFKLEKVATKAAIDRKAFFEALRAAKGVLSQADVDAGNKALDQTEGK